MGYKEYLNEGGLRKIKYGTMDGGTRDAELVSYEKGDKIDKKFIKYEREYKKDRYVVIQRASKQDKLQDTWGMYITNKANCEDERHSYSLELGCYLDCKLGWEYKEGDECKINPHLELYQILWKDGSVFPFERQISC